jgi:hypothetical protein
MDDALQAGLRRERRLRGRPPALSGAVDPERRSYLSRASFADPDGNTWQLQEITERLPGRV